MQEPEQLKTGQAKQLQQLEGKVRYRPSRFKTAAWLKSQ
ncbi:Conserved hypothetical protein [Prochlorococcus marinus str. MIT 9313]|uniref:Uncharacterized protein n=2 Tax=Prochlorococcus marinus TaxID=1219 RepID=B9ES63_PROMM|nr:Conserved hypothetical protein [Prochlorococcus marinus str. MIT 9303]CAX32201.1 Conserved hypothetical protein [Prochlorococcus marinus str. MIT 9313]